MKRNSSIFITFFILIIVSINCYSQNDKYFYELKLADSTHIKKNKKIIVIYENDSVLVITKRKFYLRTARAWTDYIKNENTIKFYENVKQNDLANINDEKNIDLESFLDYIFEDLLLRENKCLVYNKFTKRLEKKVYSRNYDSENNNFGLEYKTENNLLILRTENYSCF